MSYIINNSRGQVIAVVADGTINTSATSLALVGRGVNGYGESENENYVFLLENFADTTPPLNPIPGQLWFNTDTGAISVYTTGNQWNEVPTEAYVQAQKVSPVFTGVPQAPTAPTGTANSQIATTAFVTNSPVFDGTPRAPTAAAGTATTQIASTAFVTVSPQFTGAPTAPAPDSSDSSNRLATTSFVQAQKASPNFTGVPTAPTASIGTSTDQIATTAFVIQSPYFQGTPRAPTPPANTVNDRIATTAFVLNSPGFVGVPTAPTAPPGTANAQIATTQFVQAAVGNVSGLGTIAVQNANAVSITGGSITGIAALPVASGGTGGSTASAARNNLGLGTLSTQNSNSVNITGGDISGITPLGIFSGGTGSSTAAGARTNLGLGTLSQQDSGNVNITGGNIVGIVDLAIADGGTGASTALGARQNLGLGGMATQESSGVNITGGSISGVSLSSLLTPIPISSGGTGAITAGGARNNLGLGDMSQQNSGGVYISGGYISGLFSPLPVSSGGTGTSSEPTAGGAVYGTGGTYAVTPTGTAGTFLVSNGTGAPAWGTTVANLTVNNININGSQISSVDPSGFIGFTTNNTQRMSVNSGGNVAIGLNNAQYKLHVFSGNLEPTIGSVSNTLRLQVDHELLNQDLLDFKKIRTSNGNMWNESAWRIQQRVDVTDQAYIQFNGTDLNYGMALGTSNVERLRIDANGAVFVGRTTQLLTGARATIDTPAGACLILGSTFNSPGSTHSFIVNKGTANYEALSFRNNTSTEVGRIDCFASSTAFVTSSDYRIKDNVVALADALTKVTKLKPVSFTWKADGSESEGFIAHEVAEVAPYAVTGEKDAVNEDGSIKPQGVDYAKLVPILTAALQQAAKTIETLESRVAALENKITSN